MAVVASCRKAITKRTSNETFSYRKQGLSTDPSKSQEAHSSAMHVLLGLRGGPSLARYFLSLS